MEQIDMEDFYEEGTGTRARITDTHLIIFAPRDGSQQRGAAQEATQIKYPLYSIGRVGTLIETTGRTAVYMHVASPRLSFRDPCLAERFHRALNTAVKRSPYR